VDYSELDSGMTSARRHHIRHDGLGGPTREYAPFQNPEFRTDSDEAFKTASAKAAAWIKAHPNEKLNMLLAKAALYPTPVWVVSWGDKSPASSR